MEISAWILGGFKHSREGVFGWSDMGRGVKGLSGDASSTSEGVYGKGQQGPGFRGHSNRGDGVVSEGIEGKGVAGPSQRNHAIHGDNTTNPRQGYIPIKATAAVTARRKTTARLPAW